MSGALKLTGFAELEKRLLAMGQGVPAALAQAMLEWGNEVIGKAKTYVPVRTGKLRDSGFAEVEQGSGRVLLHLGFNTDYALAVHEDMSRHHPHGQSHFLQRALNEMQQSLAAFCAKRVPELLGRAA